MPLGISTRRLKHVAAGSMVATAAAISLASCTRFKTTDELRDEMRGRETTVGMAWHIEPCEVPAFDDFGWRLDSIGPIHLRLPSSVRLVAGPTYGRRQYRYGSGVLEFWLAPDAGELYRGRVFGTGLWRQTACSIADRPADVGTPLQKNQFGTVVRWSEAVPDETLVALISALKLEELRMLRAVLFTLRFRPEG
ncbi:MAG: hypothetical protein ACT4OZ_02900 [Gemmatimonadota bacterium]